MTAIQTRPTKLGNLLKGEFFPSDGYERETRTLTLAGTGVEQIGAVFAADGTIVVAADVAAIAGTDVSILIDSSVYDLVSGTVSAALAVLAGGAGASGGAIVVREQLKFGDTLTAGQIDTVVAAITAKGIKVATQV
jgi:hypothetical protein